MSKFAVSVANLNKNIKGKGILMDINMEVEEGNICGIIGRNASGKSMLFKCIANLVKISSGQIVVFGLPIQDHHEINIGALIEYPGFLSNFSGYKNLEILASIKNTADIIEIKRLMQKIGLDPNSKTLYKNYSLGMRQKLGVVSALMEKSPLIILDEPTNNVDSNGVELIIKLIKEYNRKYNITFIITTHHMEEIRGLCNKLYEIDNGRITQILGVV